MFTKILTGNTDTIKIILKLLYVIIICLLAFIISFGFSAFIMSKIDVSYDALFVIAASNLAVSSLCSGIMISYLKKEHGLFWGVFAGVTITAVLIIISIILKTFNISADLITKFAITLLSGAIGGIIGVNLN